MSATEIKTQDPTDDMRGRVGKIPVRNLWLLMLYASGLFEVIEKKKVAVEDSPDEIPDLVAELLCHHVSQRMRRNLSYSYRAREAVLGRVRGRIDLLYTERHRLLARGKIACRFDELTMDTPRNRYVRAALETIARLVEHKELARRCRTLALELRRMGVSGVRPPRGEGSIDRFGRHDVQDQPMVAAAHLAFELALPTEDLGKRYLSQPNRRFQWIRKLYEKGIAGFYEVILCEQWRVCTGKQFKWRITQKTSGADAVFPGMKVDIVLDNHGSGRRIVIDTKFNALLTRGWYRDESVRSGYIYQIYAYLRSQEGQGDLLADRAQGLLLHPSVGPMINEAVVIQNHEIRFATVDLSAPASEIRARLLEVVETSFWETFVP